MKNDRKTSEPSVVNTTGEKIKLRRLELGLTQTEAAGRMGVSQPRWVELESGTASPTLDTLARVAEALGCQVRDLV
jgi:transcriptional regulator with XRE-family HTH domain